MLNYFAFGSNLDYAQMCTRVGNDIAQGKHNILRNYKLSFSFYSTTRKCGAANIEFTGKLKDYVEGLVYVLSDEQLKNLDSFEGVNNHDPTKAISTFSYCRNSISLYDGSTCQAYIASPDIIKDHKELRPSAKYLKLMLDSAKKNNFSDYYIEDVLLQQRLIDGRFAYEVFPTIYKKTK